jgi:parallel beta-helix repeat protein
VNGTHLHELLTRSAPDVGRAAGKVAAMGVRTAGRRHRVAVGAGVLALLVAAGCVPPRQSPINPVTDDPVAGSQLVGCDRAAERIVVSAPTHLDPSCDYTGGVDVTTSGAVLDCRGARIVRTSADTERNGIDITTTTAVPLENVTVRNCVVEGWGNNLRIQREGYKDLAAGEEYENGTSAILVENTHFYDSTASGVFVGAYVTGTTLRNIEVSGSAAVGIYVEAGSKDNVIEDSRIHHNGFGDTGPEGVPIVVGGVELRYESTGREGIAIDGSRDNVVRGNWIAANSNGGIFLYKNCGEDFTTRPNAHWVRRYGATGNLITGNLISAEKNGVWVGARAAENQRFMDCSDPAYIDEDIRRVHLDPASDNTIRGNNFLYNVYGVRVEDDRTTVEDNDFTDNTAAHEAVIVGTKERTNVLGQPVDGTVLRDNRAAIAGNATPYRWIWAHTGTTDTGNRSHGAPVALTAGTQPTINPFLFAIRVFVP